MERTKALQILTALADGRDPLTDIPLPTDHVCQHPQVVRALCLLVQELRQSGAARPALDADPENAGKPWMPAEEAELVKAFDAGENLSQIARKHGRTRLAIQGRLYRLGKVPQWHLGAGRGTD